MLAREIWKSAQGTPAGRAMTRVFMIVLALVAVCCVLAAPVAAQDAPYYSPDQLDRMVSRIALYPDPLLAQVLAAATFPDEIPDAARWADRHRYLSGNELADRIQDDELPWDPSVQALLPFPSVLDNMAQDMRWTSDLGNAFLGNQQEVMYAVQRMRQRARDYGYLRSGPELVVSNGPYITIIPARPDYIVVPYYDPIVVYERPRPGFVIGTAVVFRFGVGLGAPFRPWGWGYNRISWNERVVVINNSPWHRTWVNRREYHHPYVIRRTVVVVNHPEHHERHEVIEHRDHDRGNSYYAHERNEERKEARRDDYREEHRDIRYVERRDDHDRHDDHGRNEGYRHDDHGPAKDIRHDDHGRSDSYRHDDHDRDDHGRGNYGHDNHGNDDHRRVDQGHDNHGNHGNDNHGNDKQTGHDKKDDHGNSKQSHDDQNHGNH